MRQNSKTRVQTYVHRLHLRQKFTGVRVRT